MKRLNFDLVVGIFILAGLFSLAYLSIQLGEHTLFSARQQYTIKAEFASISGLRRGAVVEIAGVGVGRVARIELSDRQQALVTMNIDYGVELSEDSIASISTQGIIGEKFIMISLGGSDVILADGDWLMETQSALNLEELISRFVFGKIQ